jgi:hypothetical protein
MRKHPAGRGCLATSETVTHWVKQLKANGCKVVGDLNEAFNVLDGDVVVYSAIKKGPGGPWIVITRNSERITWKE